MLSNSWILIWFLPVHNCRMPIVDEKAPRDADFDALLDLLRPLESDCATVFNCQGGSEIQCFNFSSGTSNIVLRDGEVPQMTTSPQSTSPRIWEDLAPEQVLSTGPYYA